MALRPEAASSAVWMDFGSLGRRVVAVFAAVLAAVFVVLAVLVAVLRARAGLGWVMQYGLQGDGNRLVVRGAGAQTYSEWAAM